jgi:hypothetical protein
MSLKLVELHDMEIYSARNSSTDQVSSNSKASDLYSRGARFESLQEHRLSWQRFLVFPSLPLDWYRKYALNEATLESFHIHSKSLFTTILFGAIGL